MSRLKPAFGLIAPAAGRQQAASKQQMVFEEDIGLVTEKSHLISRECVDASLQGGDLTSGLVACWHPKFPILAVATSTAVVEYDAVSGCRRNYLESSGSPVKLRYTPDGEHLILLTKERNITSWSTSTWRRRALLVAEARYAERPLVSGLLAISTGIQPVVYYSPVGKYTLRTVHMNASVPQKGAKVEKEYTPGFKLKTENRKPIVGLAAHPTDKHVVFVLLVDGSLLVCGVGSGTLSTLCGIAVQFNAAKERVQVHAVPHPLQPGAALVLVEAERSGLTVLNVPSRNEIRVLAELSVGAGAVLAGSGLLHRSCLLVAAVRHAGGNVGIKTWRLVGDSRGLTVLPVSTSPGTVWDALQSDSSANASSLADVSGEAVVAGMVPHGPSGLLAFWTATQDDSGVAHFRLPLLAMVHGEDPLEGLGVAKTFALHTAPSFWTINSGHDGVVSKLHFPRYAHALNFGRVSSYDMTHGLLADFLVPPVLNPAGQERSLVRAVRSDKQNLWIPFMQVLSPAKEGHPVSPGHLEFTAVSASEAAVSVGSFWMLGRDACFVGGRDELTAVLSNSGTLIAVFDTAKLTQQGGPKAQYIAELKESACVRLFPGPPSHIPAAPEPKSEESGLGSEDDDAEETDEEAEAALREWEEGEIKRLELPKRVLLLTVDNKLCLSDVSQGALTSYGSAGQTRSFAAKHTLKLRSSEAVVQIAWQTLLNPVDGFHAGCEGADTALACAAAVLTTERVLLVDDKLRVLAAAPFAGDVGIPTSALWVGPALLVSTSANQVVHVRWDGQADHLASLLAGPPVALLAAMADRLVLAARGNGPALMAGQTVVATRGFAVLPPMLVGWAGAAARGILPGGSCRARKEMKTLLASYDASRLPVSVLNVMASSGFADVAAAAAARSELPAVTPARKAALVAAAGDWSAVVELVESELENSEWHPNPPPKGSTLYRKVVTLARTCEAHGRFQQARILFEAAGAWNELLALCVFQGDFAAMHSYARQAGKDIQGLADQLAAVNVNNFMRLSSASAFGGRPNVEDWAVQVGDIDSTALSSFGKREGTVDGTNGDENDVDDLMDYMDVDIEVAPSGRLPFMEASLRVTPTAAASGVMPPEPQGEDAEEGQPISQLDLTTLEAYLGVAGATVTKDATSAPAGAAVASLPTLLDRTETSTSTEIGAATAAAVMAAATPRGESVSAPDSEADAAVAVAAATARGETPAQSAARAAFKRDTTAGFDEDEDDFFSSDEESNPADADARSAASFAASTSQRFLFNIKSPDETPRGGTDGASLRAAALSLKLGSTSISSTPRASGGIIPPSTSGGQLTGRSSMSEDGRSSVSSMEVFGGPQKVHTIPTPPPAAPLAPPDGSGDPFAMFANLGNEPTQPSIALPAPAAETQQPQAPIVSKDPFAELPGLPPTLAQAAAAAGESKPSSGAATAAGSIKAPLAESAFSTELPGAPMRPQQPPPVAQSDLLSGWDEFEALFTTPATPAAAAGGALAAAAFAQPTTEASAEPAPAPSRVASVPTPPAAPVPPPSKMKKTYTAALNSFKQGLWGQAADNYGKALAGASGHKDPATAASFRQQCAYLYAASILIARSAAAPPAAASRLSRYAVALPLAEEHRAIAAAFAVEANMAAGNFGWAGDQLSWLVVESTEGEIAGAGLEAGVLADRLAACDRSGGHNSTIPADEDVESFAGILGSCESKSDIDELISNLLQG